MGTWCLRGELTLADGCLPPLAAAATAAAATATAATATAATAAATAACAVAAASTAAAATAAVVVGAHCTRRPRCPDLRPSGTFSLQSSTPHHDPHRDANDHDHPDEHQEPEDPGTHKQRLRWFAFAAYSDI